MSWLMDRPNPVPSPGGLVVKNGSKIFSFTSGAMPVPLSRISNFDAIGQTTGHRFEPRLKTVACFGGAFGGRIKAVRDHVEKDACDFLRKDFGHPGFGVELALKRDIEALLLGARSMVSEIKAFVDDCIDLNPAGLARS